MCGGIELLIGGTGEFLIELMPESMDCVRTSSLAAGRGRACGAVRGDASRSVPRVQHGHLYGDGSGQLQERSPDALAGRVAYTPIGIYGDGAGSFHLQPSTMRLSS